MVQSHAKNVERESTTATCCAASSTLRGEIVGMRMRSRRIGIEKTVSSKRSLSCDSKLHVREVTTSRYINWRRVVIMDTPIKQLNALLRQGFITEQAYADALDLINLRTPAPRAPTPAPRRRAPIPAPIPAPRAPIPAPRRRAPIPAPRRGQFIEQLLVEMPDNQSTLHPDEDYVLYVDDTPVRFPDVRYVKKGRDIDREGIVEAVEGRIYDLRPTTSGPDITDEGKVYWVSYEDEERRVTKDLASVVLELLDPDTRYMLFTVVGKAACEPLAPVTEELGRSEHRILGRIVNRGDRICTGALHGIDLQIWEKGREYLVFVRYELRPLPEQQGEPGPMFAPDIMSDTVNCVVRRIKDYYQNGMTKAGGGLTRSRRLILDAFDRKLAEVGCTRDDLFALEAALKVKLVAVDALGNTLWDSKKYMGGPRSGFPYTTTMPGSSSRPIRPRSFGSVISTISQRTPCPGPKGCGRYSSHSRLEPSRKRSECGCVARFSWEVTVPCGDRGLRTSRLTVPSRMRLVGIPKISPRSSKSSIITRLIRWAGQWPTGSRSGWIVRRSNRHPRDTGMYGEQLSWRPRYGTAPTPLRDRVSIIISICARLIWPVKTPPEGGSEML